MTDDDDCLALAFLYNRMLVRRKSGKILEPSYVLQRHAEPRPGIISKEFSTTEG